MPYAVGVWLATGAFFSFLLAGPAQPFLTVPNPPADGPGPNPLLQNHFLMAIHPPFLYVGFVGMTIPFGLASAALLAGRLGHDFLRPIRTWLLVPWIFLTIAIVLGGWWAYEVLGWGGYWAWDPVENASLLPWLTATAALHSAILSERKGVLKGWTMTLVLATFLLTILGTFMTRSGVFNSVHSFTQSADRTDDPRVPGGRADLVDRAARPAHRHAWRRRRARGTAEPRWSVPAQQPAVRPVHLHGADRHGLPARGGGRARRADERRPSLLRQDVGADRRGAAVADGRGTGAALGTRDDRPAASGAAAAARWRRPARGARDRASGCATRGRC